MEYLAISSKVGAKHATILFVATRSLGVLSLFNEFPETCGFRTAGRFRLQHGNPNEVANFLQSWLYFGLISELSGVVIDPTEYRTLDEQQRPIINLGRLRDAIEQAVNHRDDSFKEDRQDYRPIEMSGTTCIALNQIRRYLLTYKDCLETVEASLAQIEPDLIGLNDRTIDLIVLSIKILMHSLSPSQAGPVSKDPNAMSVSARALRHIMMENGWCIHHWNRVCCTHDLETAYYLATLPRKLVHDDLHHNCSYMTCSAWSVSGEVTARHVSTGCDCSTAGVSTRKVVSIINSGKLPLVSIYTNKFGELSLRLSQWDGWTPYTAISHIWAEGLGNSRSNSLPQCQLRRLKTIMDKLPKAQRQTGGNPLEWILAHIRRHMFWLDTLCIPPSAANSNDAEMTRAQAAYDKEMKCAKSLAIDNMSTIYAQASHTVVIDAEIYSLASTSDISAMLAYIGHCGWTTRGWTLQEGSLSRQILFDRVDGVFDPKSEMESVRKRLRSSLTKVVHRNKTNESQEQIRNIVREKLQRHPAVRLFDHTWSQHIIPVRDRHKRNASDDHLLRLVWNALVRRKTSQTNDLPIVLANLLDFNVSDLRDTTNPLPAIIGSLKHVPVAFLYNTGPRLQPTAHVVSAESLSAQSLSRVLDRGGHQVEQKMELPGSGMLNAWIPSRIEGFNLPDGPSFSINGSVMELTRSEYSKASAQGCDIHASFTMPSVPSTFIMRNPNTISTAILVMTFRRDCDTVELEELEEAAIGFCFLSQRRTDELVEVRAEPKFGCAVLAIIDETPQRYRTVFYCAAQAEHVKGETRNFLNNIPTVTASYIGPDCVEMLYNPGSLARIGRSSTLGSIGPLKDWNWQLSAYVPLCLVLNLFAFLMVFLPPSPGSAAPPHYFTALRVTWVVLLGTLLTYTCVSLLLSDWALRARIARRFNLRTYKSAFSPITKAVQAMMDYAVNSRFARALFCTFFNYTLNISTICFTLSRPDEGSDLTITLLTSTICLVVPIMSAAIIPIWWPPAGSKIATIGGGRSIQ